MTDLLFFLKYIYIYIYIDSIFSFKHYWLNKTILILFVISSSLRTSRQIFRWNEFEKTPDFSQVFSVPAGAITRKRAFKMTNIMMSCMHLFTQVETNKQINKPNSWSCKDYQTFRKQDQFQMQLPRSGMPITFSPLFTTSKFLLYRKFHSYMFFLLLFELRHKTHPVCVILKVRSPEDTSS